MALEDLTSPAKKLKFKKDRLEQIQQNLFKEKYENEIIKYIFTKDEEQTEKELTEKINQIIQNDSRILPDPDKIKIEYHKDQLSNVY